MCEEIEKNEINIEYFKERVNHYFFNVFHLYDFELEIVEEEGDESYRARTYWYPVEDGAGSITIAYAKEWINEKDLKLDEIDKIAFHEVVEALLSELNQLIRSRFVSRKDIPNAIHRVVRRLENTIFNYIKDKGE